MRGGILGSGGLVKALSSVGTACMVNPEFEGGKPAMFICGNDEAAKTTVRNDWVHAFKLLS